LALHTELVARRIRLYGGEVQEELLAYIVEKVCTYAADFCNYDTVEAILPEAESYITELAAAEYMLEQGSYSLKYERAIKEAERGLMRFRRLRWH